MSRPIPEGGDIPETCKMLCFGASGDKCFNCGREDGDFCPEYRQAITARYSEAARLNQTSAGIPADLPDKDALIRELVESLQQWEDAMCAAICHPRVHIELVSEVAQASRKGFDVLTLARTTCPEAFDGCYETPADGR